MNSVQAAQKVWNGITTRRCCPDDAELRTLTQKVTKDEPPFVFLNALKRVRGHVMVLRAIINYEPTNELQAAVKEQDIQDLAVRPFHQECCFPDEPHKYP